MLIHKSHSKTDLIYLINELNIPVIFSHSDNKKSLHDKLKSMFDKSFEINNKDNVYQIKNDIDLKSYLINPNPKKSLSVKEKNDLMSLCKNIIFYCKNNYDIEKSAYYETEQQIKDDMDYIKQFGDIPSVRRCCRLMNLQLPLKNHYVPLISPQMQKKLKEKASCSQVIYNKLKIKTMADNGGKPFIVKFD